MGSMFNEEIMAFMKVQLTSSVAPEPKGSSPHSQQPANDSYPEPGESTPHPPQPIFLRSILIPSSHLRLGLSNGLFPFGLSHQNPVHIFTLSHACHMPCPPHSPWFDLPNNVLWMVFWKYNFVIYMEGLRKITENDFQYIRSRGWDSKPRPSVY
jgi:hypothetical protein